jgi:ketosteroid isomerase-like protein
MSQQDVELVRELLAAFASRDHERAFEFYDPDIEWDARGVVAVTPDIAEIYHGHDGVRAYWRNWLSAWRDLAFEVEDVRGGADGQVVALIGGQRQWGRHSGVETTVPPYGLVFTIRDGKVTRWRAFPSQKAALEAAALSE